MSTNIKPTNIEILEKLVNSLSCHQMTLPENIICATIHPDYHKNARIQIIEFLNDNTQQMIIYGYSSGVAREHILYRSKEGKLFLVFNTSDRGEHIYYLRKNLLFDIFENHEDIPYFDDSIVQNKRQRIGL